MREENRWHRQIIIALNSLIDFIYGIFFTYKELLL